MTAKPFYQSTTFLGLIVAGLSSVYVAVTGQEPGEEVTTGISHAVAQGFEWVGILVAFYGRWKATQPLSLTKE